MDLISAVLAEKDAKKPKRAPRAPAPAEPEEINGIRIVDEPKRTAGRPKKTVPLAEPTQPPMAKPRARAPRAKSPEPEVLSYPKPSPALALKRSSARPMPHKCDCPLCPLKN